MPGSFSHHSCFPRIVTSGVLCLLTITALCPQANQKSHLSGSRWSCLKSPFPGQEVAKCTSACSRLRAALKCTAQDADTQLSFRRAGTMAWGTARAARMKIQDAFTAVLCSHCSLRQAARLAGWETCSVTFFRGRSKRLRVIQLSREEAGTRAQLSQATTVTCRLHLPLLSNQRRVLRKSEGNPPPLTPSPHTPEVSSSSEFTGMVSMAPQVLKASESQPLPCSSLDD